MALTGPSGGKRSGGYGGKGKSAAPGAAKFSVSSNIYSRTNSAGTQMKTAARNAAERHSRMATLRAKQRRHDPTGIF